MKTYLSLFFSCWMTTIVLAQLPSSGKQKVAYTTFRNAEKKFYKGNLKAGESSFERAAKRYENSGDWDGYIAAKAMEAIVLLNKKEPKAAFRAFKRAEELYNAQPRHNDATRAYLTLCLGKYHLYYNETKEATVFLKEANKVAKANPDYVSPIFEVELQQSMGDLALQLGDEATALSMFEGSLESASKLSDEDQNPDLLAQQRQKMSKLYDRALSPNEAANRYAGMLANADSSELGELSYKTGKSYYKYTEYETAYEQLKNALNYDLGPAAEAETKAMLATIAMSIKDYQDALEQNGDALAIQLEIGASPRTLYDGLLKQGTICKELDVTGKSLYWYKKTVDNLGDDWTLEKELSDYDLSPVEHLGNPDLNENFSIALLNYERAERLIEKLPFSERQVAKIEVYMAKGSLYFTAQNFDRAKEFYAAALALMEQVYEEKNALVAEATRFLSEIAVHNRAYDKALTLINRSLNAATNKGVAVITGVEIASVEDAHYPYELLHSTIVKATVLYRKYEQAANATEAQLLKTLAISDASMEMLVTLRASYRTEGAKYELSALSERISYQAIQTMSRLYAKNSSKDYLYRLFDYIERSKSALLLQAVQQLRAQKIADVPNEVVEKENELKTNIAYLSGEVYYEAKRGRSMDEKRLKQLETALEEAKEAYPEYLDYLEENYPEYYRLKYKQEPVDGQSLQQKMSPTTTLVNYAVVDSFIHIIVITSNEISYHSTRAPRNLNKMIPKYIRTLKGESNDLFLEYSNIWYECLYMPIQDKLANEDVVIIPSGALNYLPFELIPTASLSQSMAGNDYALYKEVPYWIKTSTITYNYSATLYLQSKEHNYSSVGKGFLGFAPDFSKMKSVKTSRRERESRYEDLLLTPLANAQVEVNSIGKLTNGQVHIGGAATETIFKEQAASFGVLHLATHGILNHKYPLYSSLVLLSDDKEDGLLHTYELYNMQLNAELVALSACNTGVGKIQKGEGAMSVARGFAYAGCPNIAMTLWPVSDQATQILMENFYNYLLRGYSKSSALQHAKLDFLSAGKGLISTPYFWSGLILVGTPEPLHSLELVPGFWASYGWIVGVVTLIALVLGGILWTRRKQELA